MITKAFLNPQINSYLFKQSQDLKTVLKFILKKVHQI